MKTVLELGTEKKRLFPCPLCGIGLDVRETKKSKPYVVCDSCGVQIFVRNRAGISAFNSLVERAELEDIWTELAKLGERYRLKCLKCGRGFWMERNLMECTCMGGFDGFRCPNEDCGEIVLWEEKP